MSNMTVKVEFMVGPDLKDCIQEAKEKCFLWSVAKIHFDFNGVSFSVGANADVQSCYDEVMQAMKKDKHKFVIC